MRLQILIPQFNEKDEDIRPLLDSITMQQNIDFNDIGVVICNDGSDTFLSDDFLKRHPFPIEYHKEPHRGVSGARNACLDHATADYVMFCDADDMFYNVCGLYLVFMHIDAGFDALNSVFLEETREHPSMMPVYVKHENDATFVHGKVYRREYLVENGLRWNEKLTIHEDSYFNFIALNLAKDLKYCDTPFYLWRWRDDSVCRKDPEYKYSTYVNLIDSNDAMCDELVRRGHEDKASYFVCSMIFETYYTMCKPDWVSNRYRGITEKRLGQYIMKWEHLWETDERKIEASKTAREKLIKDGMALETITVFDWLKQCKERNNVNEKAETAYRGRTHGGAGC